MVRPGRRLLLDLTLLGVLTAGVTQSAFASHGAAAMGIVIHFTGMRAVTDPPGGSGCAVSGAVENVSDRKVTVRIRYRGRDAGGTVALATVRLPSVQPSETREFVSSAFPGLLAGCAAIRHVEMIDAVADPEP